jgi:hypothetical protein
MPKRQLANSPSYEPTPREQALIDAYRDRKRGEPYPARIKVNSSEGGSPRIGPDHPDEAIGSLLLAQAVGSASPDFLDGLLNQLWNAGTQGREPDPGGINFMLSVVKGIGPKDEVEAMLAAQMAAVHMASMTLARRLAHVETLPQQDSAERAFNKLARTFTAQVEALKRYRSNGQQTVRVERVTVEAGGQAIVGQVHAPGPGGTTETGVQPLAKQLTDAPQPPLWSEDQVLDPMPLARDAERPMPHARG